MNQIEVVNPILTYPQKSLRESIAKQQDYRYRIGDKGEEYVLSMERKRLEGTEYADMIEDHRDDPGAHYDFLSYTTHGEYIFLEVKTTSHADPHVDFYMSLEEVDFAWGVLENGNFYELHRVYDVNGKIGRLVFSGEWLLREYDFVATNFAVRLNKTA